MTELDDLTEQFLHQASEALKLARAAEAKHRDDLIELAKQSMNIAAEIELGAPNK